MLVHKLLLHHMAKQEKNAFRRELLGFSCLLLSILLGFSFFSYHPHDLPFIKNPPTSQNWIGVAGAYLGFLIYSTVGWSANLLPLR